MESTFYKNNSESNRIGKTLANPLTIEGKFRDGIDIINPTIKVATESIHIDDYNYCYIPSLGRYYFIVAQYVPYATMITLELHIDVLETYKEQIKALNVIVSESGESNKYDDGVSVGCDVRTNVNKIDFENKFNETGNFVLVCI